jgi:N-acetylglutamate synthase-like GNAT family acetyltransferase
MPHAEVHQGEYVISTDPARLDLPGICAFLEQTYWGKNRSRELLEKAFRNSLCFGLYQGTKQAGFARAITDYATYAYLADVFILEPHRKQGLGRWLIQTIIEHPELKTVRRWALITRDAHSIYRPAGFHELRDPAHHMEIRLSNEAKTPA